MKVAGSCDIRSAFSKFSSGGGKGENDASKVPRSHSGGEDLPFPSVEEIKEMPEKFKYDKEIGLESLFSFLAALFIVASLVLFYYGYIGSGRDDVPPYKMSFPPDPRLLGWLPYSLGLALAMYVIRQFIDNYYIFDTADRIIYYHFGFFGYTSVTAFIKADEIFAFGVNGKYHSSYVDETRFNPKGEFREWCDYSVCLIRNDGRTIDYDFKVSGFAAFDLTATHGEIKANSEARRRSLNSLARTLAAAFGCRFAECPEEHGMKVENSGGPLSVTFTKIILKNY